MQGGGLQSEEPSCMLVDEKSRDDACIPAFGSGFPWRSDIQPYELPRSQERRIHPTTRSDVLRSREQECLKRSESKNIVIVHSMKYNI